MTRPRPGGGAFLWGPALRRRRLHTAKLPLIHGKVMAATRKARGPFCVAYFSADCERSACCIAGALAYRVVDAVLARLYQFCIGRGQVRSCTCETPGGELRS